MYAARAAGQTAAIEPLVRLGGDVHDNVREAAIEELARLKRAEALAVAYEALARPDYQLVMTAARALAAETDKPKATAALIDGARPHHRRRAATRRAIRAWRF